jgi:hypothetical protein
MILWENGVCGAGNFAGDNSDFSTTKTFAMNNAIHFITILNRKAFRCLILSITVFHLSSPLMAQFNSGASVTDNSLLNRTWHITNKSDYKLLVPVNGELRDNSNTKNETSSWIIEDIPDDGKWWTADKKWFAIRNAATGLYVTIQNTITPGKGRDIAFEELGPTNNPSLRTRQQFEVVPVIGNMYKIRTRVDGSSSWGKLILKCEDDGKTYAVQNNLSGDRVLFAFNLALPASSDAVYTLVGANNFHFISDRGKSSENSQLVHQEDQDHSALWNFIKSGDGDYYYIRNGLTGNYISNNGNNNDNALLVMKLSPDESAKWEVIRAGTNIRIRSKGGGTIVPQFIGINGHPTSGHQLYGAKSNVIGIEWTLLRILNVSLEPVAGNYDKIPTEQNPCPVLLGNQFKLAMVERTGLPANEAFFPLVHEALKKHYNDDTNKADNALANFDLNNIGHRAELVHAFKYYLLNDVAMRSPATWTLAEMQAIEYFNAKVREIRIDYGLRLQQAWNEFIAGQYNNLSNSGLSGILNAAIDTDFEWPSDYDLTENQIDDLARFASATKTFNLGNDQLNLNIVGGVSLATLPFMAAITNSLIFSGISSAASSVFAASVSVTAASGSTSPALLTAVAISGSATPSAGVISAAIGNAGTPIAVIIIAAQVLAAQIMQGLDFQRLENKVNLRIALSQGTVLIPGIMQSDDELAKLKLITDMEVLFITSPQNGYMHNFNDNFTFEPFTLGCNNIIVSLDENCTAQIQPIDISGGIVIAICGGSVSMHLSKSTFTNADIGQQQVMLSATNSLALKTCTATVTVQDNTPPTALCKNVTVQLNNGGNASLTAAQVDNGSSDACGILSRTLSKTTFDCSNVGTIPVILTVTDNNNKSSQCSANVTVQDNMPPVAKCKNRTVQLDASGNGSLTAAQVDDGSHDMCGIYNLSLNTTSFTCANVGNNNTVVLTVEDVNNNTSSCTATVTVVDNVPPVALCQPVIIQLDANGNGSLTTEQMDAGSNDACGIHSLSLSDTQFDCTHVGPNLVTLTVTDNNNKVSQCAANVMVQDNVPPVALCQSVIIQLDANGQASLTAEQMDAGSNDACGIQSRTLNRYTFDCSDLGTVPMTLTVKDQNNNESTCNASVIVQDNIFPEITCPANIVVSNDPGDCSAVVNFSVTASDNCTFSVAKLAGYNTGQPFPVGVTTNEFQVTDAGLNQASCSFTVTVNKFGDPDLLYAYTVIGFDGVDLKENSLAAGGIGIVNANKSVKLTNNTVINAANTFVKAPMLNLTSGSSAQVHHQGQVAAGLLPVFIPNDNPGNNDLNIADNSAPVTLNLGNYGKITIGKNVTATFFGNSSVFIKELKLKEGATLLFSQNTSVHIDKKLDLDKNATLDRGSHTVWMFVEDDVKIEEGSTVLANIYSLKSLKAEKATAANPTELTGLFIAESVDAKEFVQWNWNEGQCPFIPNSNNLVVNGSINLTAAQAETTARLTCVTNLGPKARSVVIERSADGINFKPLFEMEETELAEKVSFGHYLDNSPLPGLNFYRAAAEMEDGTTAFSPVRMLEYSLTEHLNLFPNPANTHIRVFSEKRVGKPGSVFVFNSQGVQVFRQDFDELPGHILTFDLSGFRDGLYLLTLRSEGGRDLTKSFIVARF